MALVDEIVPAVRECAATVASRNAEHAIRYIESDQEISTQHLALYNALRVFVDDILQKKVPWKLSNLSSKLLQIVDHNNKHHDKVYATDDMVQYLKDYATTNALVACCMGSNYDLESAKQCILDIVQWRVCSKIDEITPMQFRNSLQSKSVWSTHQIDKKGHPICHFKVLETPPDDPWKMVRAAVFSIEKCIKLAEQQNVYQILWMVDNEHLGFSTLPPMEVFLEISNLMTYYYPERLYKSYMLFTPWVFSAIFKALTPYLPPRTQQKIAIPGWYESEKMETFQDDIDQNQLAQRFGGSNEAQYDYQWELEQFEREQRNKRVMEQEMHLDDEKGNELENGNGMVIEEEEVDRKENEVNVQGNVGVEDTKENEGNDCNPTDDVKEENLNEDDDEDDSKLCIVCLDGDRDHVIIPCGHICVCTDCMWLYSRGGAECPICRAKVSMVVRTFR